jgi:hypothetical protein
MMLNADSIAQKSPTGKGATRIDRNDSYTLPHLPKALNKVIEEV